MFRHPPCETFNLLECQMYDTETRPSQGHNLIARSPRPAARLDDPPMDAERKSAPKAHPFAQHPEAVAPSPTCY